MPVAPDVIAPDDSLKQKHRDIDRRAVAPLPETGRNVAQPVGVVDKIVACQQESRQDAQYGRIDIGIHEESIDRMPLY